MAAFTSPIIAQTAHDALLADARRILLPGRYPPNTFTFTVEEWQDAARLALEGDTVGLEHMLEDDAAEPWLTRGMAA